MDTLLNGWRGTAAEGMDDHQSQHPAAVCRRRRYIWPPCLVRHHGHDSTRPDGRAHISGDQSGYHLNVAAFNAPTAGQWGAARRNSVIGPEEFSLDASMSRTFRLRPPFNLDVRMDATNLLNDAAFTEWNSIVNSTTFGLPAGTNPMRSCKSPDG